MKLIETYGTGLSKIISCYKGLLVQPTFENVKGAFRVILPNIHGHTLKAGDEKYLSILELFKNQNEISRSDVEKVLDSSTTHAVNMLKEMQIKKLIRKIGNGKLTRYILK